LYCPKGIHTMTAEAGVDRYANERTIRCRRRCADRDYENAGKDLPTKGRPAVDEQRQQNIRHRRVGEQRSLPATGINSSTQRSAVVTEMNRVTERESR
jgi:hypothetical protein